MPLPFKVPAVLFKAPAENSREAVMLRNSSRMAEIITTIRDTEDPMLPVSGPFASSDTAWSVLKRLVNELE